MGCGGGGSQSRVFSVTRSASGGGAACRDVDGAIETQACGDSACPPAEADPYRMEEYDEHMELTEWLVVGVICLVVLLAFCAVHRYLLSALPKCVPHGKAPPEAVPPERDTGVVRISLANIDSPEVLFML